MYMLCSDGFRKMISGEEIQKRLAPSENKNSASIKKNLEYLMELNMERKEKDNITALALRVSAEE